MKDNFDIEEMKKRFSAYFNEAGIKDAHVSVNQYGLYTLKDINYKENGAAFKYYFAGTITPEAENYASELKGKENQVVRVKFAVGANQDWDLRGDVLDIVSYEKEEEKDSHES